jgi:tripartite ATP-independent transporter DctP family solute receptor
MEHSRRHLLKLAAATSASVGIAGLAPLRAHGRPAAIKLKFGTVQPAGHPTVEGVKQAADAIRQETGNQVDIQVYPNSQLGSDTDMLSQLRAGALHCTLHSGLILSSLVPVASINGVGFAFKDYDQVWAAMDGDLGRLVRADIEKAGLVPMSRPWDTGFRHITSSGHAIASPADLKGFKIRVPISAMWTSLFKNLGASPAGVNFGEVYSALQTRMMDGQENPLGIIQVARLYEVQKYLSLTGHMWDGMWFLFNGKVWAGLPKDIQEIVSRQINAAVPAERAATAALNGKLVASLAEKGLVVNKPDVQAFRSVLTASGFYGEWRGKFGAAAWGMLEKYTGNLA